MEEEQEAKISRFLSWLQVNGVELRDCSIRYCGPNRGFGIFSANNSVDGILLVVPLDLAITPMRVLQDPYLGPKCRAMFEEGDVDDRFLMILFLTVERLREQSTWKPYLDMLPSAFGSSIWFREDELSELKGTTLYRATKLQKEKLQTLFEHKVKALVEELLKEELENEVQFEDFIWANSVFWTRALNLPLPRTFVFPEVVSEQEDGLSCPCYHMRGSMAQIFCEMLSHGKDKNTAIEGAETMPTAEKSETIWVEGLVPGIDFCNHAVRASATWEVDGTGSTTGFPCSMYLLSAEQSVFQEENEITISYGNKGNEELLYLYGFVLENNPDDYLMVHYPIEALQHEVLADFKGQLLEIQGLEMRCLLPRSLLENGFFQGSPCTNERNKKDSAIQCCSYSWGGQRKVPSYLTKLVFPEDFLAALRTVAMKEKELLQVSTFLEELVESREEKQPSGTEVRAAVWEACGDSGALQLLINLLQAKMMELEEGTGTEFSDSELLKNASFVESEDYVRDEIDHPNKEKVMSKNRWSAIVYRRGQKQLTHLFLMEAEHALELCLNELE